MAAAAPAATPATPSTPSTDPNAPAPPSPPIDLGATLTSVFSAGAGVAGAPVALDLPTGADLTLSAFSFDANITASEIRLVGGPGAVLAAAGGSSSRRALQTSSTDDLTIFTVGPGAPPIFLAGLTLRGRVRVDGGSVDIDNCTFSGVGAGAVNALSISAGEVTLNASEVRDYENGGISLSGGVVDVRGSVIRRNGHGASATFGGVEVAGGQLNLRTTSIEYNGQITNVCDGSLCLRGGGLSVVGASAQISISDQSVVKRNMAYEGDQIYVDTAYATLDSVRYTLPTPLGHYVIITDRSDNTPVSMQIIDATFPFECSPGNFGGLFNTSTQTTPRCSGRCPAGHYCPSATVVPIRCAAGTYCVEGSEAETNCPAGTFSAVSGLGSIDGCTTCRAGSACEAGSAAESPCPLGMRAPTNGSVSCEPCPAGTYQDKTGQTLCTLCRAGRYCPVGSAQEQPCLAGKYASETGLMNASQCTDCPVGHYCTEGTSTPQPCLAGTIGEFEGLAGPYLCQECIAPSHSEMGSTVCDQCLRGNYRDPYGVANASANQLARCRPCLDGATCENGVTLASHNVSYGFWRLSESARKITECHKVTRPDMSVVSSCRGGVSVGNNGSGYCEPGHHGPLCELCDEPEMYFRRDQARCISCPRVQSVMTVLLGGFGFLVVLGALLALILYKPPRGARALSTTLHRAWIKMSSYALLPKLKILIALYQMVVAIPTVYDVALPPEYYEWMQVGSPRPPLTFQSPSNHLPSPSHTFHHLPSPHLTFSHLPSPSHVLSPVL